MHITCTNKANNRPIIKMKHVTDISMITDLYSLTTIPP